MESLMPKLRRGIKHIMGDYPALDEMILDQSSEIRNVYIDGKRTSLRLRSTEWSSLHLIAEREGRQLTEILKEIDGRRGDSSLAGALRLFTISYFRELLHLHDEGLPASAPPRSILHLARP